MTEKEKIRFSELLRQGKSLKQIAEILKQEQAKSVDELFGSFFRPPTKS